ncbi:MAG TPA: hypothetical protein VK550_26930, partial [Polyangiaceae bacterium]|nr:hypothetical protein [Polyangiaceae bacterium]
MRIASCLLVGTTLMVAPIPAYAVCVQNDSSAAEWALWDVHGCPWDFVLWEHDVYDTRSSDWANRGYNDACNIDKEYGKHWNASYLTHYGLQDNPDWSFHGSTDYEQASWKYDSVFHDDLYHTPTDDTSFVAQWAYHSWTANELRTSCLTYNATQPYANPAGRGSAFVHEGWHGWQDEHGYSTSHLNGPSGACSMSGANCDYWYWHGIGAYAFGDMWGWTSNGSLFHSPNQAGVEYLCDVADFPHFWVPSSVTLAAASHANTISDQRFVNG